MGIGDDPKRNWLMTTFQEIGPLLRIWWWFLHPPCLQGSLSMSNWTGSWLRMNNRCPSHLFLLFPITKWWDSCWPIESWCVSKSISKGTSRHHKMIFISYLIKRCKREPSPVIQTRTWADLEVMEAKLITDNNLSTGDSWNKFNGQMTIFTHSKVLHYPDRSSMARFQ